jgi:polysaccharide deacetylase 2 family uncharacterized protein YibQ
VRVHPATHCLLAVLCLHLVGVAAGAARVLPDSHPAIALIIDDLGHRRSTGLRAISLPGPVACSFFPFAAHTRELALQAHARGKEVMLHLPMQAVGKFQDAREAGVLTLDMTQRQYRETFQADLASVPFVSGFNNHMGSLLTQHPGNMAWLMRLVRQNGKLFFVDSRTTRLTVARELAGEYGVPSSQRNVFLDDVAEPDAIRAQFRRLLRIARRDGSAIAIGHPYPATLDVLSEELVQLDRRNVRLVRVADLIRIQQARTPQWQTLLSR